MASFRDDFPNNVPSDSLAPDVLIREKVKHYSMCLFGLATDMQAQEDKYINYAVELARRDNQIAVLKRKVNYLTIRLRKYYLKFGALRVREKVDYEKK